MSNSWDFTLCAGNSTKQEFCANASRFLSVVQASGYQLTNCFEVGERLDLKTCEHEHPFEVCTDSGQLLGFKSAADVITQLTSQGGLIAFWNGNSSIFVSIDFHNRQFTVSSGHTLHPDSTEDRATYSALLEVFIATVAELQPLFGYSVDEFTIEHLAELTGCVRGKDWLVHWKREWGELLTDLDKKNIPRFIFWLNYFRLENYERLSDILSPLSYKTIPVPSGVLVALSDYPWTSRYAVLMNGKYEIFNWSLESRPPSKV